MNSKTFVICVLGITREFFVILGKEGARIFYKPTFEKIPKY